MSDFSDDLLLTQLQRAAAFIQEVRLAQAECGKKLAGATHLTSEQGYAITKAADESSLVKAVKSATEADMTVHDLFERFEEMCRRRKIIVEPDLRSSIVKIL